MMERRWAWHFLVALATVYLSLSHSKSKEFPSDSLINNVVADPRTGRLYVGAVNALYQLNPDLEVESQTEMGPKRDNWQCTPPVTDACEDAKDTDNHNKLLLVHGSNDTLVVCGSIFRGLCSLRNLSNVEQVLYFSDTKGEKSYVASAEESVSVVGVMSYFKRERDSQNFTVFLVGKGYGSHDSTKLISTRILQDHGDWVIFDSIIEASAVQANPFVLRYLHDFRFAFNDGKFVYFLFSRTLGVQDNKNFTFISRMCQNDPAYYSYTELQLNCSADNKFNKAQAAYVATPGKVLAQRLTNSGQYGQVDTSDKVLFVTFTSDEDPTQSAMCMYPLSSINKRLLEIIGACYSNNGIINGRAAAYSPYSSKSEEPCITNAPDMAERYKCGAEILPSPLASKAEFALTTEPQFTRKGHMTAVAVAVEMGHTVAFLGTATGEVHKVHLSENPEACGRPLMGAADKVNKNLLFDSSFQHLYITNEKKITKVPVQACHLKTDCHSCVSMKDPYCGWCVLEGKCTRKQDCSRSEEENTWLWSPNQKCVQITDFNPQSISCKKTQQVDIIIPTLPRLRPSDSLMCVFGSFRNRAVMPPNSQGKVTCSLPDPVQIPQTPDQQDFVSVPVKVLLNDHIEVTSGEYQFHNCAATVRKNPNTPCIACVTSSWGCQWNAQDHSCSDSDDAVVGNHIVKQSEKCPQFESPEPLLIPVGFEIPISFQGSNLDIYQGQTFVIGTELMKDKEDVIQEKGPKFEFSGYKFVYDKQQEVNVSFHIKDRRTERKIDSMLTVVLYNCSVGREDCSLCKHADAKYRCVWCTATHTCVYQDVCKSQQPAQCPDPEITDIIPRFGPLNGRISVTIKGSNMGIKKEDIKKITVAGVDCVHQEDRYSVSTSVVCEIGPAKRVPPSDLPFVPTSSGEVEIEVEGGRKGKSRVIFTYRDPKPERVSPAKGPLAGGTVITIEGRDLDTATKEDVTVTVGESKCEVLSFGNKITCKTSEGKYRGPTDTLTVTVKYGKNTTKDIPAAFQYCENPKVTDYNPKNSFICGGRSIVVTGSGFDLIQKAVMKVQLSADESSPNTTPVEFVQEALSKNDTVLHFDSPAVNCSDTHLLKTVVQLDNEQIELKGFIYHPDPTFDELAKNVITETSIIIVTGRGFSRAMTAKEAQVFVGDASCHVNILQDDKLILEAPPPQPSSRSKRQRRDTTKDLLELVVKFGHGEWKVGSVYYARKEGLPLAIIIPAAIIPMLLLIAVSVYCYRRKSQQTEHEYEMVKRQLDNLEERVRRGVH